MPVLRGSVTLRRFRVELVGERPKDVKRWVQRGLKRRAFEPIDVGGELDRAAGWVELEHNDRTDFAPGEVMIGEYALFAFRVDRLRVPGPILRAELDRWSAKYEADRGHPPGRAEKRQQKDLISKKLRARVFPSTKTHDLAWSLVHERLDVWSASAKIVEEIQFLFEESFEVRLHPLTPGAIAEAMDVPAGALWPTAALVGASIAEEVGPRAGRTDVA